MNFKNPLINVTHGCSCSGYVNSYALGMFWFWFCYGTACGAIAFAMATGMTLTCSLGRRYGPILSLSFFDAYGISDQCSLLIYFIVNHSKNICIKVFVTITPLILPQCLPPRFKIPGQNAASISPL